MQGKKGSMFCTIYIFLWIFYNLQGTLYASGSFISQFLLLVIIIISLYTTGKVLLMRNRSRFIKGLDILLTLFTIYGFIRIVNGDDLYITEFGREKVRNFVYLKEIYCSLLPIYTFYYFSIKGYLNENTLRKWVIPFFVVAICEYYRIERDTIKILVEAGLNDTGITNNSSYLFLSLIPALCLYYKKPAMQYIGLIICLFFVLMGAKRGAIIISLLIIAIFQYYNFKNSEGKRKTTLFVLSLFLFYVAFYILNEAIESQGYLYTRIQKTLEGDAGGIRNHMYSHLWNVFLHQSDVIQILFGRGAWGTLNVNINFAHNDWLEILTNQGVLGVLIFCNFFFALYKERKTISNNVYAVEIFVIIFTILFTKTLFSMSYSDMNIYLTSIFGFVLAKGETIGRQESMSEA